jgi:hypothetical protein
MIDALQPALAALLAEPENLQAAFAAAQAGADRTCQSSKAGAGRASYLNSDSLLGNMDPAPTRWRWCLRRWRNDKPPRWRCAYRGNVTAPKGRSGKALADTRQKTVRLARIRHYAPLSGFTTMAFYLLCQYACERTSC